MRNADMISRGSFDSKAESWDRPPMAELGPDTSGPAPVELPDDLARSPPRAPRFSQGQSLSATETGTSLPAQGRYRVVSADVSPLLSAPSPRLGPSIPYRSSQDTGRSSGTPPQQPPHPQAPPPPAPAGYIPNDDDRLPHAPEPYRRPPGVPPLPPKEPLSEDADDEALHPRPLSISHAAVKAPYPDSDGPPPPVNLARKPMGRRG